MHLPDKGHTQGRAPVVSGIQAGGGRLFFPVGGTIHRTGQAVPWFDADKLGNTRLAPDQHIGEAADAAHHATAGVLFVKTQGLGGKAGHAVAVIVKQVLVHIDSPDILTQVVMLIADKTALGLQADGRFHAVKPQFIVFISMNLL